MRDEYHMLTEFTKKGMLSLTSSTLTVKGVVVLLTLRPLPL